MVDLTGFHQRVINVLHWRAHTQCGRRTFHCETGRQRREWSISQVLLGGSGMEPGVGGNLCRVWPSPLLSRRQGSASLSCSILVCQLGCGPGLAPSEVIFERNALIAMKMPNHLSGSASQATEGHVKPRLSLFFSIRVSGLSLLPPPLVEEGPGWRSPQALLELGGGVRMALEKPRTTLNHAGSNTLLVGNHSALGEPF